MTPIISDSPLSCTGADSLWEKPTSELDKASTQQITLEWIQSLSSELKDAALYRMCKTIEVKPTLVESFALNQVFYRTISGGSFSESTESVARRTGHDRKTILKGLDQAVRQNILEENKRPGTSNEYSFKPVEEWKPEPERVVRIKDIRNSQIIEFPLTQDCTQPNLDEETEVVRSKDDHETDPNKNIVVVNKLFNKQQLVSVPILDTPTIWRSLPDGNRYAQIPPIHDQDTGVEIHSSDG